MVWLERSRFGLFIRSIREDEEAAAALAVNTVRYKILVFVITSMMAAAADKPTLLSLSKTCG